MQKWNLRLLEKCQEDGDCYVNGDFQASRCINNICNCSLGYYQRKYKTCRPDAKVHGKQCIINNDCKGWINNTCDNYICDTSQTHIRHIARLLYNDNIEKKKYNQERFNTTLKRNVQRMRTVKNLEMQLADL
ncbi:uncharacterized protein LOC117159027 isoform X3 [Bombus vancouverensis nearcticus]|uniref:uncharacterized protein LOC117159027 isoform X3 n=1 Tax=Bombus vancouverensis nearcticus TaxID=2705178 RepID=UPI00402B2201